MTHASEDFRAGSFRAVSFIVFLLNVIACIAQPLSAEERATPIVPPAVHFILDFLPPAIYSGDGVTACFRVENSGAAAIKLQFVTTAYDAAGAVQNEKVEEITATPRGFVQCQASQDSRGRSRIRYALRKGAEVVASVTACLLPDGAPWPETKFRNGRMEIAASGEILIPTVTRRTTRRDRAFAPVKWLLGSGEIENGAKPAPALVLVPTSWLLQNVPEGAKVEPVALEFSSAPPVLVMADAILQKLDSIPKPGEGAALERQIVLWLPGEDLETATDPWIYRIVVDALLARVNALRFKKAYVIPPFHFGANEKRAKALVKEVSESAAAYGISVVDHSDFLHETLWRVDPEQAGVYGWRPNPAGLKKIEQGLWNLVR